MKWTGITTVQLYGWKCGRCGDFDSMDSASAADARYELWSHKNDCDKWPDYDWEDSDNTDV
ncbi:MAG: hypothetical protein GY826_03850 [Fuerstiella sp.]|nr:hypothetical protein [Fuerstiella sp.]